jgi:hypothetical protein
VKGLRRNSTPFTVLERQPMHRSQRPDHQNTMIEGIVKPNELFSAR